MHSKSVALTEAEWTVMECLWEASPRTGREIVEWLQERNDWSRSTCLTLLRRLEAKDAVYGNEDSGVKRFRPLVCRDEVAVSQAKSLLDRAYHGSLSLLVNAFTKEQTLSQNEIEELYSILKEMEEKQND